MRSEAADDLGGEHANVAVHHAVHAVAGPLVTALEQLPRRRPPPTVAVWLLSRVRAVRAHAKLASLKS